MAIFNEEKVFELLNEGSINLRKNPLNIKSISMVIVHTNEGDNVPHFHIKRDGKHDCCIMLNEDKYFNHGSNDSLLSTKEAKELNNWLHKSNSEKSNETNFQVLGKMWNATTNVKFPVDIDRNFDYANIAPYK